MEVRGLALAARLGERKPQSVSQLMSRLPEKAAGAKIWNDEALHDKCRRLFFRRALRLGLVCTNPCASARRLI